MEFNLAPIFDIKSFIGMIHIFKVNIIIIYLFNLASELHRIT